MIRCPVCRRALTPADASPYAPICSQACRRVALKRAGYAEPEESAAPAQFAQLRATHLYCNTCGRSMPTRERLLLTLPTGDLYGYFCAQCGTDVGTKKTT